MVRHPPLLYSNDYLRMDVKKEVAAHEEEMIDLRRDFHRHPELGFQEFRTADIIADYLRDCGLDVSEQVARTGVVGVLQTKDSDQTVLLRADMDALPIDEENDIPYKSTNPGKMHACGHDGHLAMLLIAAKILTKHKSEIQGNIKFVFQPNEETGGARLMIKEGVLENLDVDAAFGVHLWTPLRSGQIGVSSGDVMGGLYEFELIIRGQGGHTSAPQSAVDPILSASKVIQAVQEIQTRETDPLNPTVIMFGEINGGTATNIIPEEVKLGGTIRYLRQKNEGDSTSLKEKFERKIKQVCYTSGTEYELQYIASSPPVHNDEKIGDLVKISAKQTVGSSENIVGCINLAGEDFAEFTQLIPSCFYFIGTGNKEKHTDYPHHHPRFNIDEDTLAIGVEMHVRNVLNYFNNDC